MPLEGLTLLAALDRRNHHQECARHLRARAAVYATHEDPRERMDREAARQEAKARAIEKDLERTEADDR